MAHKLGCPVDAAHDESEVGDDHADREAAKVEAGLRLDRMLAAAAEHVEADGAEGEQDDELQHNALP